MTRTRVILVVSAFASLGAMPPKAARWEFALLSSSGGVIYGDPPPSPSDWRVDVYSGGWLEIARDGAPLRWAKVPPSVVERMRSAVAEHRLFDTAQSLGFVCVHCPRCDLMVSRRGRPHWVTIARFRPECEDVTAADREQAERVLQVIDAIKAELGAAGWPDECR